MSKFTIGEVEKQARQILLDDYEDSYRFEPQEIYQAIADAVQRIRVEKPTSRYVNGFMSADVEFELQIPSVVDSSNIAATRALEVNMERKWMMAVVYYVIHRMYLKDDPDTTNQGLSTVYFNMYTNALGS